MNIDQHLQADRLVPVYVIQSEDELLTLEARDALLVFLKSQGFYERYLYTQGTSLNWHDILASLSSPSLFDDRCVYDIRLPEAKLGRDGASMIIKIAEHANTDHVLIFSLPYHWSIQKMAWMKQLTQRAVNIELKAPTIDNLPNWLNQRLQRAQVTLSSDALRLLCEYVDGNLLAAAQEINKLATWFAGKTVDVDDLTHMVVNVSHFVMDDFRQSVLSGDWKRVLRILDRLEGEGESPLNVARILNTEVHKAIKVYAAMRTGTSESEAMRHERLFYERARMMSRFIKSSDKTQLFHVLLSAEMIDLACKEALVEPSWSLLRRVCVALIHHQALDFQTNWKLVAFQ